MITANFALTVHKSTSIDIKSLKAIFNQIFYKKKRVLQTIIYSSKYRIQVEWNLSLSERGKPPVDKKLSNLVRPGIWGPLGSITVVLVRGSVGQISEVSYEIILWGHCKSLRILLWSITLFFQNLSEFHNFLTVPDFWLLSLWFAFG